MVRDEIVGTLKSWDAKSLVSMAHEDDNVLMVLINLLDDERFQLRVLSLLEELLPSITSREIYRELFPRLLFLLRGDRKTATKAAKVMRILLSKEPPTRGDLLLLFKTMLNVKTDENDFRWLELADISDELPPIDYEGAEDEVMRLMKSGNPSLKLVGVKFGKQMPGVPVEEVIRELSSLLTAKNPVIVDKALDLVVEVLASSLPVCMEDVVRYLYSPLKALAESAHDAIITSKAREVFGILMKSVQGYYSLKPSEAVESAKRLRKEGLEYEAMFIEEIADRLHAPVPYGRKNLGILTGSRPGIPDFLRG